MKFSGKLARPSAARMRAFLMRKFETTTSGLGAYVQAPGAGAKVTVSVDLRDERGASIEKLKVSDVALKKAQPNGAKCEPTCFSNVVDFDPATRSLVGRPLEPDVRH